MRPSRSKETVRDALVLLALCAALPSSAADASATPAPAANPSAPTISPQAVAEMDRMGTYLGSLRAFTVHAETSTDEILHGGAKVQYQGWFDLMVRWPDRLRVSFQRDGQDVQEFFYDGSSLTVWIKAQNVWASTPAPGSIPGLIEMMHQRYALPLPLEDLLLDGAKKRILDDVVAGTVIGPSRVMGVACDHLGFHQADVDWQIWIAQGDQPLPRKYLITTLGEASQPQHSELLTWDLAPKIDDTAFTFTPPTGAQRIVFAEGPRPAGEKRARTPAPTTTPDAKKEGSP
jgi:hypothetical protein